MLRALCDLPAVDPGGIHDFVGHVVTNGLATVNALYQATRVHSRQGRAGVPAFRAALEHWLVDGRPLDSELERQMRRVAQRFGLPRMEFHAIICGYEVDFWVVGTDVVVECDGWEAHDKRRQRFDDDRKRRAELTANGYVVINFTWRQITRTPQWVASMVTGAVARSRRG